MCGIIGVIQGRSQLVNPLELVGRSFRDLEHRGQHGAGIAVTGNDFWMEKGVGRATVVFDPERPEYQRLAKVPKPRMAVGHARYATQGKPSTENMQPHVMDSFCGEVCCLSNGDLPDYCPLRQQMEAAGAVFKSRNDAEYILRRVFQLSGGQPRKMVDAVKQLMLELRGAYSAIIMTKDIMIVFRDPWGIRPLVHGVLGDSPIFASETCTIKGLGADVVGTVRPGEIVIATPAGIQDRFQVVRAERRSHCILETIYLHRPDSKFEGVEAGAFRYRCGKKLNEEHPVPEAEFVSSVPRSGDMAAIGYAAQARQDFRITLIHKPSVGRQFIGEPESKDPREKFSAMEGAFEHRKRGVWVDDSVIKGGTWARLAKMIREAGAKEVHLRVASPPNCNPCRTGIHTPDRDKLWVNRFIEGDKPPDLIRGAKDLHLDSLEYLSIEGLKSAFQNPDNGEWESDPDQWCTHCLDGRPIFSEIEPVTS